ncbi:MAG: 2-oxoacid:ferredoxin oxidoreductase subunit beta [Bdellovibrionales bacterium]|jgi:2-oxoglutarate ferredoxin oxidoreductase subunit beta|nr:2-oxoacid:ferredoxin oxidoreductase subunit beta [Bdellovibrionales bacterium]
MNSVNSIGLSRTDYSGSKSTLCTGCGHDSVTGHIISAFYKSGVVPYQVAKLSGIGCSSKTPAYFMNKAHGFNAIHGRMAPVATGVKVANSSLVCIGVSGDGDTASIGVGGFVHLLRRNLPLIYIVENNGVFGLTKGQFSATADKGSRHKSGEKNPFSTIDLCSIAIDLGCSFVARSFSGDAKQLVPLIEAAIHHRGTALIDIISPCITFANHEGSTKSYGSVREHNHVLQELGFIQAFEQINVDYNEGEVQIVQMPDGSKLSLKKLNSSEHDVKNAGQAIQLLTESRNRGEILTGMFYLDETHENLIETLQLDATKPLAYMSEGELRPPPEALKEIMTEYR